MIIPPPVNTGPPSRKATGPSSVFGDRWLLLALVITATIYMFLVFLRPTGENWGRGWNMVVFLIYSAPAAALAAGIALWRSARTTGTVSRAAVWVGIAAVAFTPIAIVVIRSRN